MKIIRGIAISQGVANGKCIFIKSESYTIKKRVVKDDKLEKELLHTAIEKVKSEINTVLSDSQQDLNSIEEEILQAHLSILEDPELIILSNKNIEDEHICAEYAFSEAINYYCELLSQVDDDYIKSRTKDLYELKDRVAKVLMGKDTLPELNDSSVIVCINDLTVNTSFALKGLNIIGYCTKNGSKTDHAAILARSKNIPLVTGLDIDNLDLNNSHVIVDGFSGNIIIDPDTATNTLYNEKKLNWENFNLSLLEQKHNTAITKDGKEIKVYANISDKESAELALANSADGIGLFRTEFIFIDKTSIPNEDDQFKIYLEIFKLFNSKEVIVRLADIGMDKSLPYLKMDKEENPALGNRGIRLALNNTELILKPQIKAILRAAENRRVKIMLPMVTNPSELTDVRKVINECYLELKNKGISTPQSIAVGIMIEVPSAALRIQCFQDSDFFSIGTNDLTQYVLAADRTNQKLNYLFDEFNPAVVSLIHSVILTAKKMNKPVEVCGELASNPIGIAMLLSLGLEEMSVSPSSIPLVKHIIRNVSFTLLNDLKKELLKMDTSVQIKDYLTKRLSVLQQLETINIL